MSQSIRRMAPIVALVLLSGCPFTYAQPYPHDSKQEFVVRLGPHGSEVVEGVQSIADEFGQEMAAELEALQVAALVADNAEPVADTAQPPAEPVAPALKTHKESYKLGEKITVWFEGTRFDGAAQKLEWTIPDAFAEVDKFDDDRKLVPYTTKPGNYTFGLKVTSSLVFLTPDPADPTNPAKYRTQTLTLVDEYSVAVLIEGATPPTPVPPGPNPPGPTPTPTPDDPWGVASVVQSTAVALGESVRQQAAGTAAIFRQAAEKLDSGEIASIGQAAAWLQAERKKFWGSNAAEWAPVENAFAAIWNSNWPLTKSQVIDFYRLVATGLEAVE